MIFREFSHKQAHYKISADSYGLACRFIEELRLELEEYICGDPFFLESLVPVQPVEPVPPIARRMIEASLLTGLGPMASVAGVIAQMACERIRARTGRGCIIENGGDLFLDAREDITLGLYAGKNLFKGQLAFYIKADSMPLAVCSSSGTMGHSLSFGHCDLATVVAKEAALADSAATLAGNLVKTASDLEPTVNHILSLPGITGVFLVKGNDIGLGGNLPELISVALPDITSKITRDRSRHSSFNRSP